MNRLLAACAGLALIGSVGATQLDAQRVTIRNGDRSVTVEKDRHERRANHDRRGDGYYQVIKKKVWVPGHYDTVTREVWVPGRFVTVRERRVDRYGCVSYVNVRKFVKGHYETCEERVFHPGHYKVVTERVWVPADCAPVGHGHEHRDAQRGAERDRRGARGADRGRGGARGRGNARGRGR